MSLYDEGLGDIRLKKGPSLVVLRDKENAAGLGKQCRPRSDATAYSLRSGSTGLSLSPDVFKQTNW